MCGIAGAVGTIDDSIVRAVERMSAAQLHRGPDADGLWADAGVVLAHRRLAIIDLSPGGRQPMIDAETGNAIVFNGEIYNFVSLRRELEGLGCHFRTRSDTEVILKAYATWGEDSLVRLRGMFAFALWNARERTVLLARDRMGIKPLYVATIARRGGDRVVLFASEVRSILASGLVERALDPAAVATYVWNGFVVGPTTIVRDVTLFPAAASATVSAGGTMTAERRYWQVPQAGAATGSTEALASELAAAVGSHLVSDVPLGVFLSGGIDSSAVAALAMRAGGARVRTFNIGFDEAAYDESRHARAVAQALGTEHHELRLGQEDFRAALPTALAGLDQPTFDGINTYFVSRAVREAGLTVALAGTGGDELFGGYRSFRDVPWAASWARRLSRFAPRFAPGIARSLVQAAAARSRVPAQTRWGKLHDALAARGDLVGTYQVSHALFASDFGRSLQRSHLNGEIHAGLPAAVAEELAVLVRDRSALAAVAALELRCFLGERLLRDTDSASMASSIEVRVPFLDHEVVTLATSLDDSARFAPVGSKRILRNIALGDLDPALFDRPKSGFVLPIERWARDAVRDEMSLALNDPSFCESAGLDPQAVGRLWNAFLEGARGLHWSRVWAIFVLGWWCRENRVTLR